jgi:hypothetical protein
MAADTVRTDRRPVAAENPGRVAERAVSDTIAGMLGTYGQQRDALTETLFRQIYDSAWVRALAGVAAEGAPPRLRPAASLEHRRFVELATERLRAAMDQGGLREAVLRALIWIRLPTRKSDERAFGVIRRIREAYGPKMLPLAEFKRIMRQQFFMLMIDEAAAVAALPALLPPDPVQRAEGFAALRAVVMSTGEIPEAVAERLAVVERMFLGAPAPADAGGAAKVVRALRPQGTAAA